jgi:hypothetical protein
MSQRRTSGEIVNATLFEVCLALTFIIFAVAVFEQQRADAAEHARDARPDTGTYRKLRDTATVLRARVDTLQRFKDSLRSTYPPDCESHVTPPELLVVTLVGPGQLTVTANRDAFGLTAGQSLSLTLDGFDQRFADVRTYSAAHKGCRFLVRIRDTNLTSKDDYKQALSVVSTTFRPRDAFR